VDVISELKLLRVLKLGATGKDVRAMKRGLARAGHGMMSASVNPLMGPFGVRHLTNFQVRQGLVADGKYGEQTHGRLIQFFDAFARQLYEQAGAVSQVVHVQPPVSGSLQLPRDFVPTHETAGLPGFPAVDVFADPGTTVLAPEDGIVDRLSGHDPKEGGHPGGAYGFTIYVQAASGRYFLTHFGSRQVTLGQHVKRGDPIGTVCDSAVSHNPGTSHIHAGKQRR
jgi:murein DD-endopeptidase MepM/ murein hydrolase activator NlpD